jgi:hypothetical protein
MLEPERRASGLIEPATKRVIRDDLARHVPWSRDGADRLVERVAPDLPPAGGAPEVQQPTPGGQVSTTLVHFAHIVSEIARALSSSSCVPERESIKPGGLSALTFRAAPIGYPPLDRGCPASHVMPREEEP